MKINGVSIYIVSIVLVITTIIMNVKQYHHNPFWYQNKQKEGENFKDVGLDVGYDKSDNGGFEYTPTWFDSFLSIIGVNGYYVNGVALQTIYICFTYLLYIFVEHTFGSLIAIIIFIVAMISNYYYTWNVIPTICGKQNYNSYSNNEVDYNSISDSDVSVNNTYIYNINTFSNMSNLTFILIAMVQLILYNVVSNKQYKLMIIILMVLTYIGTCIYDLLTYKLSVWNSFNIEDKICNATMKHGFYFIQGILLFYIFNYVVDPFNKQFITLFNKIFKFSF